MKSIHRSFSIPKKSFFLLGPRGLGKSTFLKQWFPDSKYIDFLNPETLKAIPENIEIVYIVQDRRDYMSMWREIQRIGNLF